MDHYDSQAQRREIKHKGRNVVWSIAMDKCLIEALSIQARNGNKIDKCFNENAYTAACIAVNSHFNLNLNNQKVVNRLKTIKKRYKVIKDMLSHDGFRWNPNTKMIVCDDENLWKRYIAAHPDARGFRGKQIEMYDELKRLPKTRVADVTEGKMAIIAARTKLKRALYTLIDNTNNDINKTRTCSRSGARSIGFAQFSSSSSSAAAAAAAGGSRGVGLEVLGVKDYEDYRRSLYGDITHKALLVDAVGTLVVPSQPMAQIYRQIGEKYGVAYSEDEILNRYRRAYGQPWGQSRLRYVNDGRPFWQYIVSCSTGCSDSQYFEELYNYYTTEKAWHLCDPDAEKVFRALRKAGVKLAVVSNFDTRLRLLLQALDCDHWFDAVAISAEVAAEKPNPTIFLKACELLGVNAEDAVHVGDDHRNDVWGARDAGCDAWLWGSDVHSFEEVAERMGVQV